MKMNVQKRGRWWYVVEVLGNGEVSAIIGFKTKKEAMRAMAYYTTQPWAQ